VRISSLEISPVEPRAQSLQTQHLKSRLALRLFTCNLLERELETASFITKPALTLRREETLKECYILQFVLDLLEREKREKRDSAAA
jgi:hypothetical protein